MNATLINRLTWEDIKEIASYLGTDKSEEEYREVLVNLGRKYKTLPACKERFKAIIPIAEKIVGKKLDQERSFEAVTLRCMLANKLRDEGFCCSDIARTMRYNHATILYYLNKKKDFFSLPLMYEREVNWFKRFDEYTKADGDDK